MNPYMTQMEDQLRKWDADVDALVAKGERAGAATRARYHQSVKDLRENRAAAQQTFREMQAAGLTAGAKVQAQMEAAYETMQKNFAKAVADLRKK